MSNTDEIVERLLNASVLMGEENFNLMHEAAALIKQQRDEIARLRDAYLRHIQIDNGCIGIHGVWLKNMRPADGPPCDGGKWESVRCGCAEQARAALARTTTGETDGPLLRD